MKTPLIIANWKMNLNPAEAAALAKKIAKVSAKHKNAEIVLCPSFTEIAAVADCLRVSSVALGAQDCFWEESGAFTGEISPASLRSYGVRYVLVGHSERREYLSESGAMAHKKVQAALNHELVPVLCVGESFVKRQEGQKEVVIIKQLQEALGGLWLNKPDRLVVAYEPIWVIGSGQAVTAEEAEHTHLVIRQTLYDIFPHAVVAEQTVIIYGGSVDPENAGAFMRQATVGGVLVGTASLDAAKFSAVIAAAK